MEFVLVTSEQVLDTLVKVSEEVKNSPYKVYRISDVRGVTPHKNHFEIAVRLGKEIFDNKTELSIIESKPPPSSNTLTSPAWLQRFNPMYLRFFLMMVLSSSMEERRFFLVKVLSNMLAFLGPTKDRRKTSSSMTSI